MTTPDLIDAIRPDPGALAASSTALVAVVARGAIRDRAELEQAAIDRQHIGAMMARVRAFFERPKKLAHELHKTICEQESSLLAPLVAVDRARQSAIAEYDAAQDRARRERERELAAAERRARETAAASEAAALEAQGEPVLAAALLEDAIAAPAPVVALRNETRDVVGLKFVRRWLWRIGNAALVPREFLTLDDKKIGAYVRAMKGSGAIPGIEIYYVDDPTR